VELVMVEMMVMVEAKQQIDPVKLEGQPTVVEDVSEGEDIVPIYLYYYQIKYYLEKLHLQKQEQEQERE
jgi:hypothetical protein